MCGVVGVIGTPSRVNRQVFQDMLCLGAKRGPHSTGVAAASRKGQYVVKDVGLPWDLLRSKLYQDNVAMKNWPVLMGHNRWATVGNVTPPNAHPFWHENVILMHNGTLETGNLLDKWVDFETDSEVIAYNFAKYGVKETYKKMAGAWTLVWFDTELGTLNVITNGQRPFNFIRAADGKSLYWASEEWIARFAADGRGVELEKNHFSLNIHNLYSFFIDKSGKVEYTTEALESKPYVPFVYVSKGRTQYSQIWDQLIGEEEEATGESLGFSQSGSSATGSNETKSQTSSENQNQTTTEMGPKKKGAVIRKLYDDKGQLITEQKEEAFGPARFLFQNEEAFKAKFGDHSCVICGIDVKDEYETALMIDPETVACGSCHKFADINDVKLV